MEKTSTSKRILGFPDAFWIGYAIMVAIFLKLVFDIQHDYAAFTPHVGKWTELAHGTAHSGNLGVIQYYFTYHHLPDFSPVGTTGYANPPFFYIFCAGILELTHRLGNWAIGTCLHCISCLNAVFVMIGSLSGIGLLRKAGIRGRGLVAAILFLLFFPAYYFLGQRLNGDAMAFMFSGLALNAAAGWFQTRRKRTLIFAAVFFGLGTLTSYAALAVLPAILALVIFAGRDGRTEGPVFRSQVIPSAIIAGAMSLVWPVYNRIRFGVPLFYAGAPEGFTPIGSGVGFFDRMNPLRIFGLFGLDFSGSTQAGANIPGQTTRSVFFSDYLTSFNDVTRTLARLYLFLGIFVLILMHALWIWSLFTDCMSRALKVFTVVGYVAMIIGYIAICLAIPYVEMADVRFIPAFVFFPLLGLASMGKRKERLARILVVTENWAIFALAVLTAFLLGFYA